MEDDRDCYDEHLEQVKVSVWHRLILQLDASGAWEWAFCVAIHA